MEVDDIDKPRKDPAKSWSVDASSTASSASRLARNRVLSRLDESLDSAVTERKLGGGAAAANGLTRQASLPAAPDAPGCRSKASKLMPKLNKPMLRMNSDSDLHIQPISQEEERVMDTLDEIDLLHNIAKTPNLLAKMPQPSSASSGFLKPPSIGSGPPSSSGGKESGASAPPSALSASTSASASDKRKLVKQKSLNRTLSTSVLRIKKKRCTFWNT